MNYIKIHQISGYIQTLYLVEYDSGLLLLDSGCRCDVPVVEDFIRNHLKKSMDDLKLVVVTHAHPDHSGGAMFFKKKYKTHIAGPLKLNDWYAGLTGILTYFVDLLLTYLVASKKAAKLKNIIFPRKIYLDYFLEDLNPLPFFSDWTVLTAPGHTASDISLWNERSSLVYIADNLVSSKTNFYRPYPISYPEHYKKTLKRYLDLNIKNFLLAHKGEHQIPRSRISELIETSPQTPRNHKRNLIMILKHLLRALIRKS